MSVCAKPASRSESSSTWWLSATPKRSRRFGSKKAPMPVSNSTVLPLSGVARSARVARRMRLRSSGTIHLAHIARGALPNIEPPSSRWELPSIDQSFMRLSRFGPDSVRAGAHRFHRGLADRVARVAAAAQGVVAQVPFHRLQVAPDMAGAAAAFGLVAGQVESMAERAQRLRHLRAERAALGTDHVRHPLVV